MPENIIQTCICIRALQFIVGTCTITVMRYDILYSSSQYGTGVTKTLIRVNYFFSQSLHSKPVHMYMYCMRFDLVALTIKTLCSLLACFARLLRF